MVPPDTCMVCEADKYKWKQKLIENRKLILQLFKGIRPGTETILLATLASVNCLKL